MLDDVNRETLIFDSQGGCQRDGDRQQTTEECRRPWPSPAHTAPGESHHREQVRSSDHDKQQRDKRVGDERLPVECHQRAVASG